MIDGVPEKPVTMASACGSLNGPITVLGRSFALHFSAKAVAALGLMKEAGKLQAGMALCGRRQNDGKTGSCAVGVAVS